MKTNAGHLRGATILLAILLVAATLSACTPTEQPSEETALSTPMSTSTPMPTAMPTSTPMPTPMPTPEPTLMPTSTPMPAPESSRMSLDEYAAFCAELEAGETTEEEGEITYGEFSAGLQLYIGLLASVNPPQEVSDWHNTLLTSQRELKAAIDEYPGSKDDPIELERFFTLLVAYHEGLSKTARALDPALLDWLIAAGCMDEDVAAASFEGWQDGGNGAIEREELTVGVGVEGALDETSETDYFIFRAEEGKEYLIEAVWEGISSIRVEISDGSTFSRSRSSSRQPLQVSWTAPESGEFHLNVTPGGGSEGAKASYTVSVNAQTTESQGTTALIPTPSPIATSTPLPAADPTATPSPTAAATVAPTATPTVAAPSRPSNLLYAIEGSTIRVSWDAVEGADYYNLYYHNFFDSSCSLRADGSPGFCEELATNVVSTTYLHTDPSVGENFYWVVACNQAVCSEIDSDNPAGPVVDRPTTPSTVTYAWEGTAIRISWDAVEGADYYNLYYNNFFDSSCSLGVDGSPRFCEELATNLDATTYVHPNPAEDKNFYWVVACNQGGCSEIVSDDPAKQNEAGGN